MICGSPVSLLFWLHLDSQSFKILRKFYLPDLFSMFSCYVTSDSFLLFINKYCWPEHVIRWAGRESYWSNFYLASKLSINCVSHQVIRGCVICLGIVSNVFTKMLCSLCTEIYKPALKYLARYTGLNNTFEWITQPQFSYMLPDWFGFGWYLQTLIII